MKSNIKNFYSLLQVFRSNLILFLVSIYLLIASSVSAQITEIYNYTGFLDQHTIFNYCKGLGTYGYKSIVRHCGLIFLNESDVDIYSNLAEVTDGSCILDVGDWSPIAEVYLRRISDGKCVGFSTGCDRVGGGTTYDNNTRCNNILKYYSSVLNYTQSIKCKPPEDPDTWFPYPINSSACWHNWPQFNSLVHKCIPASDDYDPSQGDITCYCTKSPTGDTGVNDGYCTRGDWLRVPKSPYELHLDGQTVVVCGNIYYATDTGGAVSNCNSDVCSGTTPWRYDTGVMESSCFKYQPQTSDCVVRTAWSENSSNPTVLGGLSAFNDVIQGNDFCVIPVDKMNNPILIESTSGKNCSNYDISWSCTGNQKLWSCPVTFTAYGNYSFFGCVDIDDNGLYDGFNEQTKEEFVSIVTATTTTTTITCGLCYLHNITCPTNSNIEDVFPITYYYYSTPNPTPYEIRGLLVDSDINSAYNSCKYNESDANCVWNKANFTAQCPSPGLHNFNITCIGDTSPRSDLCYQNDITTLGCVVNCTYNAYRNVTLVYNVTTSNPPVERCSVENLVWYDGGGSPILDCINDNNQPDCFDTDVTPNAFNNITLLNLAAPQRYWWNIRCSINSPIMEDLGDNNWTFMLN